MRKLIYLIFGFVIIGFIFLNTFLTPHLIATAKKQYQLITGRTGFLSQATYIKHVGLKNEPLKKNKITWPNKEETILTAPIASNQLITISQP